MWLPGVLDVLMQSYNYCVFQVFETVMFHQPGVVSGVQWFGGVTGRVVSSACGAGVIDVSTPGNTAGRRKVNTEPFPTSLSTQTSPPQ